MHNEVMNMDRRRFLGRAGLAGAALVIGGGVAVATGAGETPELAELRQRVAAYARRVTVRADRGGELDVVCEISDLGRFAAEVSSVVPADATAHVAGNVLSYEQNGRRVRVENRWRART